MTRFFCGFYDVGELGTLVDGIVELSEESGYRLINQPRQLAMMLLSDHVFAQSPKTMRRLLKHVTAGREFGRFAAVESMRRRDLMEVTDAVGREMLCDMLIGKLEESRDVTQKQTLRRVISEAADVKTRKELWKRHADLEVGGHTLGHAVDFNIVHRFDVVEIEKHTANDAAMRVRWLMMIGRYNEIDQDTKLRELAWEMFCNGEVNWVFASDVTKPEKDVARSTRGDPSWWSIGAGGVSWWWGRDCCIWLAGALARRRTGGVRRVARWRCEPSRRWVGFVCVVRFGTLESGG